MCFALLLKSDKDAQQNSLSLRGQFAEQKLSLAFDLGLIRFIKVRLGHTLLRYISQTYIYKAYLNFQGRFVKQKLLLSSCLAPA